MEEIVVLILFVGSLIPFNLAENSTAGSNTGATIIPNAQFDENAVADKLDKIFQNNKDGHNEVIDLLTDISNDQRQKVRDRYDKKHPNMVLMDMVHDYFMKKEGEDVANNMKEILRTPGEFLARRIDDSISHKSKESGYLYILCAASVDEIKAISDFYPKIFGGEYLHGHITHKFSSDKGMRTFLLRVTDTDIPRAHGLADNETTKKYIDAIPKSQTNCEDTPLVEMCATQSLETIKLVAAAYDDTATRLHNYCDKELNRALEHTVRFAKDKFKYFADEAKEWLKDTKDSIDNVRSAGPLTVIWRAEIDLADIKKAYDGDMWADFQSKMSKTEKNLYLMKKLIDGNRGKV